MPNEIAKTQSNTDQFYTAIKNPDMNAIKQRNTFLSDVHVSQRENGEILVNCIGIDFPYSLH